MDPILALLGNLYSQLTETQSQLERAQARIAELERGSVGD